MSQMLSDPYDTPHPFTCPADPTDLTPRILWDDPPAAAAFLGLETNREAGQLDDIDWFSSGFHNQNFRNNKRTYLKIPGSNIPKYLNWKLFNFLKFLFIYMSELKG